MNHRTVWEQLQADMAHLPVYDVWQCVFCGAKRNMAPGVAPIADCIECRDPRPATPLYDYIKKLEANQKETVTNA